MKDTDFQDLEDLVESVKRHARKWMTRSDDPTTDEEAEAHAELVHAYGALERLASAVDVLRGEMGNALMEHQTDQADALSAFWDENVGDREYGIGEAS